MKKIIQISFILLYGPYFIFSQSFSEVAKSVGLNMVLAPGFGTNGAAVADYDKDGDLDIYLVSLAAYRPNDQRTWNRLYRNLGDGTFEDATASSKIVGRNTQKFSDPTRLGYKYGASWADYNNDGYPDLFLTNLGFNQLYRNNHDGTFTDVSDSAGIQGSDYSQSTSSVWWDYDKDGDLDLYVSNWYHYYQFYQEEREWPNNYMYENLGNGTFEDISASSGLNDTSETWTSVSIDINRDGLLDLYTVNDTNHGNKLYINNGDKTFTEKSTEYGIDFIGFGMGVAIADCDDNGFLDIYVTNITENGDTLMNPLYLNTGSGAFINSASDVGVDLAGWGWGTSFVDIENDGDDDLAAATGMWQSPAWPNKIFLNAGESELLFLDKSKEYAFNDSTAARALIPFDYDTDGDQDFLISNFFEKPFLMQNNLNQGNWINIMLRGTISNSNAFGSMVTIYANGKRQMKFHHGAAFLSQNILPIHFGVNDVEIIDSLEVRWTNGLIEKFYDVPVNTTVTIEEDKGIVSNLRNEKISPVPNQLKLHGNYPNPFNPSTTIEYQVEIKANIRLTVYDVSGREINTLVSKVQNPGSYSVGFDASGLSSGVYIYKLSSSPLSGSGIKQVQTRKMILLK